MIPVIRKRPQLKSWGLFLIGSVWNDLDQSTGNRKRQWGYPVKTLAELSFRRSARCKSQANDKTQECVSKSFLPTLKIAKTLANFSNKKGPN